MNNKVTVFAKETFRVQPWKNGMGSTLELACDEITVAPYFNWRISIATLSQDGLYSAFPEAQRTQLMLEGECVRLYIDAAAQRTREVKLTPFSQCSFSGFDQVQCRLHNDVAAKMFNLMTLADKYESRMQLLDTASIEAGDLSCDVLLVYSLSNRLIMSVDTQDYLLEQAELLKVSGVSDQTNISIKMFEQANETANQEQKVICVQLFLKTN
jgi:environmental stress-induced protein Ves